MKTRTASGKLLALLGAAAMLTGCATPGLLPAPVRPAYHPDNVFRISRKLPEELRRVLVLPLTCSRDQAELLDSRDTLEAVLIGELIKTKKFEVVKILPSELRRLTGRAEWKAEDVLPATFFSVLQETYGCDAILFAQVTDYRAYPPMAIGWRTKLVDARSFQPVWAGDELFDAGQPRVQSGALRYKMQEQDVSTSNWDGWASLNSPRRFGQYSIAQLLDTLPVR